MLVLLGVKRGHEIWEKRIGILIHGYIILVVTLGCGHMCAFYIYIHLYFWMQKVFYNRKFKIILLIEKFEIIIINADLKRQTDFCNQIEANRYERQIKTKQHKGN